jgi:ubiquinone/menaquinone biosynthesis C-methylase UbiE
MSYQDKTSERDYYDQLFATRKRFDQFTDERLYETVAATARQATSGSVALDLGCGSGTQAVCLMKQGFSVVSADLSLEATKLCRTNTRGMSGMIGVVNADAEALSLKNASVDACICSLFLHHFSSLDTVASELRRIVRPGGVVVATDTNGHNPFVWLFFNVMHRVHRLSWLTPNQRALTRGDISDTFGRHGFGDFQFSSFTTELRRDWLGDSFAFSLNYHTRQAVLGLSRLVLPPLSRGNGLLSTFRRLDDGAGARRPNR